MREILIILCACAFLGCSKKVTEEYTSTKQDTYEYHADRDSVWISNLLKEIRNNNTSSTDSIVIVDSIFVKEYADGSRETYHERTSDRVHNYVTKEQIQDIINSLQYSNKAEVDTIFINKSDTTTIYKEKEISSLQRNINTIGISGLILLIIIFLGSISLRFTKK